jgi:hypothetical protein
MLHLFFPDLWIVCAFDGQGGCFFLWKVQSFFLGGGMVLKGSGNNLKCEHSSIATISPKAALFVPIIKT